MHSNILVFLLVLLFWQQNELVSQSDINLDSLREVIKTHKKDSSYLKAKYFLAQETGYKNLQEGEQLAREALDFALKLKWKKGLGTSYQILASILEDARKFDEALTCYEKAKNIKRLLNDKSGLANTIGNMALVYRGLSQYQKSNVMHLEALEIYSQLDMKYEIGRCYGNIANNFLALSNFNNALAYLQKAIVYFGAEKSEKGEKGLASSYSNMAIIFINLGEYQKALEYNIKAYNIRMKLKNNKAVAEIILNRGTIYYYLNDTAKAMECYLKCLKMRKDLGDLQGVAKVLGNIGSFYATPTTLDKSLYYSYESLKIRKQINDLEGVAHIEQNIAVILLEKKQFKEAERLLMSVLNAAKKLEVVGVEVEAWNTLSKLYSQTGKDSKSLEAYKYYIVLKDSIASGELKNEVTRKEILFGYEMQSTADSVKNAEEQKVKDELVAAQKITLKQEKSQRYVLYGGLILVLCFFAFVFYRFRITNRQKIIIEKQKVLVDEAYQHLEEKNKEVMDSIYYARRIQRALITNENYIHKQLIKLKS